jgi:hypothetical protein
MQSAKRDALKAELIQRYRGPWELIEHLSLRWLRWALPA